MKNPRLAYLALAHKNPEQVNAFVRQIAGAGQADVYLHVDAKCPDATFRAFASAPNVKIVAERVSVSWGDYNGVVATLILLRAMRASGKTYDFVSLNSGQDLLVRDGLLEHLAANEGRIFMYAKKIEEGDPDNFFWRIKWPRAALGNSSPTHPSRLLRVVLRALFVLGLNPLANRHELPENWTYHRGSQWFCVSGEAAAYMLEYLERHPSYADAFKDSLVSDMAFFHTLIMNSPFAAKVTGAHLTYLRFGKGFRETNSPTPLTMRDLGVIADSGLFFARKFEPSVDAEVIRYFCAKYGAGADGQRA